ncbi:MAG: NAD-dependent epimerase/dehydratase family protein [Novosphingobium sp.]
MKALVIGGTGPTGPFIVRGLLDRGYEVAILHRGKHEIDEIPPEVEHIHTDPNFVENLEEALAGRRFDLCIASYGRLRFVAEAMVGKTDRFVALGASSYRGISAPDINFPRGEIVPIPESRPFAQSEAENRFSFLIAQAERRVFELHPEATYIRIPPFPYGPHQVRPREWLIIKRILDKRPFIILPDGGLTLYAHGYAENLAHCVLLAVDNPAVAGGRSYNCADERQLTLRQIVEVIADELGSPIAVKGVPLELAEIAKPLVLHHTTGHNMLDLFKAKSELGYSDCVPSVEAIRRTTRWLIDHPVEPGSHTDTMLGDIFDYDAEDRFLAAYEANFLQLNEFTYNPTNLPHPYAHPKARHEADHHGR